MPDPIIKLVDINLSLGSGRARVHVLKGVNLEIRAGEKVGLVGPSGSGKSTALMILAGLERPDSGQIFVNSEELSAMDEDALARFRGQNIGIVFQSFHLIQTMTALENVAVPLELAGKTDAFEAARKELTEIGLGDRLNHYPAQLSGGEQQRVALARAMVTQPAIIIADEPTGNLDGDTGKTIVELLFNMNRERNTTLVLVTHDMSLAGRCDRSIRIRNGLIETGETRQPAIADIDAAQ